jgi:hypothetical protein
MPQLFQILLAFGGIVIFSWIANYLCYYQAEKEKKHQEETIKKVTELTLAGLESKTEPKITELIN